MPPPRVGEHIVWADAQGGPWTFTEKKLHINALELKAIHIALMTFAQAKAIHIQTISQRSLI